MAHKEDMSYNGSFLDWYGVGKFPASSGLSVEAEEGKLRSQGLAGPPLDPQAANFQDLLEEGPIPEGLYSFPLVLGREATLTIVKGSPRLDTREGIESLPDQWMVDGKIYNNIAWGPDRVRLTIERIDDPEARKKRTGGFYLHDSTKGYSHGCVEADKMFFVRLRALVKSGRKGRLYLKVKYPSRQASTFGGKGGTGAVQLIGKWAVTIGGWSGEFEFSEAGSVSWSDGSSTAKHKGTWQMAGTDVRWRFSDAGDIRTFVIPLPIATGTTRLEGSILPAGQGTFSMQKT